MGLSLVAISQVTVSGNIKDNQKNPLFGVEIYAPELHIGTTSDLNGNYKLQNLPLYLAKPSVCTAQSFPAYC